MLLPDSIEPRAFLGPDSVSFSEVSALTMCERKWHYSYVGEREEQAKSVALARGTEMHRLTQHWWMTGEVLPSEDETAAWLLERYVRHYECDRRHGLVEMIGVEIPFAMRLDRPWDGHVFGFFDGLVRVAGIVPREGLWIDEKKTMKDWARLNQLPVDRQVSLYIAAARAAGYPVRGVLFDAIRTQRWVRGDRPTTESFERVWIERTQDELDEALEEMYSALALRDGLTGRRPRRPLRNVGSHCDFMCSHKAACFGMTVTLLDESSGE